MRVAREAGIGLHERLLDLVGRHRQRLTGVDIGLRNLHGGARLADGFEIGVRAQSRAGAVLVPFVEDQARRRHQIEHGGDDVAVEPRRRPLAEFRKAVLVLRPQPVHHEGIGPRPALLLRRRATLAGRFAERRRPGQRQDIEVELTGLVLAPVRSGGVSGSLPPATRRKPPMQRRPAARIPATRTMNAPIPDEGRETISQDVRTFQEQNGNKQQARVGSRVTRLSRDAQPGMKRPTAAPSCRPDCRTSCDRARPRTTRCPSWRRSSRCPRRSNSGWHACGRR